MQTCVFLQGEQKKKYCVGHYCIFIFLGTNQPLSFTFIPINCLKTVVHYFREFQEKQDPMI